MMPPIMAPRLDVSVKPLTRDAFTPFGTVIENPTNAPKSTGLPRAVKANQGTATKYIDVSQLTDYYDLAPSKKPARAVMNMFVCSPRQLQPQTRPTEGPSSDCNHKSIFPVEILERHPFTPQTFIPMGLDPRDETTAYLVIVAPTLPTTSTTTDKLAQVSGSQQQHLPKGNGKPDLNRAQAFIANGAQAVTYGPGTWHAPMVALGARPIDFLVVQYANDVSLEDCQEIEIEPAPGQAGINVVIENERFGRGNREKARL